MLLKTVRKDFKFEYVLFDIWFFSKEILAYIELFRNKNQAYSKDKDGQNFIPRLFK